MQHVPTLLDTPLRAEPVPAAGGAIAAGGFRRATSVRLVGRRGAIAITRRAGEVVVTLEGERVEELLPRAAAELSFDLGRLEHLVVDASQVHDDSHLPCARWAEAHRDRAARITFIGPEAGAPPSIDLAMVVEGATSMRGLIATRPPRPLEQARLA